MKSSLSGFPWVTFGVAVIMVVFYKHVSFYSHLMAVIVEKVIGLYNEYRKIHRGAIT